MLIVPRTQTFVGDRSSSCTVGPTLSPILKLDRTGCDTGINALNRNSESSPVFFNSNVLESPSLTISTTCGSNRILFQNTTVASAYGWVVKMRCMSVMTWQTSWARRRGRLDPRVLCHQLHSKVYEITANLDLNYLVHTCRQRHLGNHVPHPGTDI